MPNSVHSALVNPLELSSWAGILLGPNALMPAAVRSSTMPAASGVWPDHHELDRVRLAERDHGGMVGHIERHAFRLPRDAGIAGRAPEFGHQGRGRDLPRQGMFAAAGTEQENVHRRLEMRGFAGAGGRTNRGGCEGETGRTPRHSGARQAAKPDSIAMRGASWRY